MIWINNEINFDYFVIVPKIILVNAFELSHLSLIKWLYSQKMFKYSKNSHIIYYELINFNYFLNIALIFLFIFFYKCLSSLTLSLQKYIFIELDISGFNTP